MDCPYHVDREGLWNVIAVVSYGVGNVKSIANMLGRIGAEAVVTSEPAVIRNADRVILPGVGAFDTAIQLLNASGVRPALEGFVQSGRPLLGICLGMQLLGRGSAEGVLPGLNLVDSDTELLHVEDGSPLPHMGWNWIAPSERGSLLREEPAPRYYFLHSYAVRCDDPGTVAATAEYGGREFVCAIQQGNVFGVQFHPEKSHRFGMRLLTRFAAQR